MIYKKIIFNTFILLTACLHLSWTSVTTVSNSGDNFSPSIAVNINGHSALVWTNGSYPDLKTEFSFYNGLNWSLPEIIDGTTPEISPVSAIDSNGNVIVAWESIDAGQNKIAVVEKPFNSNWSNSIILSTSAYNSNISLDMNSSGQAVIGWIDQINQEIQVASLTFGNSWSAVTTISSPTGYKGSLKLKIDSNGNAFAVFENYNTGTILASKTTNGFNSNWSAAEEISSTGTNTEPSFALSATGNGVVAWTNIDTYEVFASIYQNGVFQTPSVLSNDYAAYPSTATSGTEYFVSWCDLAYNNILGSMNDEGVWNSPFQLSNDNQSDIPKSSYQSGLFYTTWVNYISGEVNVMEYPINQSSQAPIIISDGEQNISPIIRSSETLGIVAWESVDNGNNQIQVNMN